MVLMGIYNVTLLAFRYRQVCLEDSGSYVDDRVESKNGQKKRY